VCVSSCRTTTGRRRPIRCLILISHFPPNSPIISGSFAKRDLKRVYVCRCECMSINRHLPLQMHIWVSFDMYGSLLTFVRVTFDILYGSLLTYLWVSCDICMGLFWHVCGSHTCECMLINRHLPWQMFVCIKPTYMSKEPFISGSFAKRDLKCLNMCTFECMSINRHLPWQMFVCMRPTYMSKETHTYVKSNPYICQKRPMISCSFAKRDLKRVYVCMCECMSINRHLPLQMFVRMKPTYMSKESHTYVKRDLYIC